MCQARFTLAALGKSWLFKAPNPVLLKTTLRLPQNRQVQKKQKIWNIQLAVSLVLENTWEYFNFLRHTVMLRCVFKTMMLELNEWLVFIPAASVGNRCGNFHNSSVAETAQFMQVTMVEKIAAGGVKPRLWHLSYLSTTVLVMTRSLNWLWVFGSGSHESDETVLPGQNPLREPYTLIFIGFSTWISNMLLIAFFLSINAQV